jgi:phenylacetate-CoA ligase
MHATAASDVERGPREQLRELQLERLRTLVARLLDAVAPTRARLHEAGVRSARDVRSLDDLRRLPFSMKSDLREHYPFGLLAVPREELVRVHASSGTGGKATIVAYTRRDLDTWTEVMARCLATAGVRPGMLVHNANGYGLFTGGLGFHQGAERLGATVVPVSGGFTGRQVTLLRDLQAQVLFATPSYALHIGQALGDHGIGPDDLALEVGVFGGEAWTPAMGAAIEDALGLTAVNMYGLSEIVGPGVAVQCREERAGSHVNEDHFLVEVIDPETGELLPDGDEGELVFSTLTKEALPLLRYRTGDIASIDSAPCPCGRTLARMGTVRGRRDEMLIIRGVNLYPSAIEHALLQVEGVAPHYQLVVERPGALDELTVRCEPVTDGIDGPDLRARIARVLRERTGISIKVELLAPGTVPRSEGKAVRVVDQRPR